MTTAASIPTLSKCEEWLTMREQNCSESDLDRMQKAIPFLLMNEELFHPDDLKSSLLALLHFGNNSELKISDLRALCSASVALRTLRTMIEVIKAGKQPERQGLEYRKLHALSVLTDSDCTLPLYNGSAFPTGYDATRWSHCFTGDPKAFTFADFRVLRLIDEEMEVVNTSEKTKSVKFVPTANMTLRIATTTSALQGVFVQDVIATVTSYLYCPHPHVYFFADNQISLNLSPWWEKPTNTSDLQPLMDAEIGLMKSQDLNPEIYSTIKTPEKITSHIVTITHQRSTFKLTGTYDGISSSLAKMTACGLNPQPHQWVRTSAEYERSVTLTEPVYHHQFLVVDVVTRKVNRLSAVMFKNHDESNWETWVTDIHAVGLKAFHYTSRTFKPLIIEKDYSAVRDES